MTESGTPRPPDVFVVLDALDAARLASFWAKALHYRRLERMEQYEVLAPPEGVAAPVMLLQQVTEPTPGKLRMHLDLHVPDAEAEAHRLVALGATRIGEGTLGEIRWICMSDPEGNVFDLGWQ
ncbi:MAG: VOC family protein [Geodermatophilaceae bacterium]|nr:VOC family protein [Geodermatophilaceae bacterium]